MYKNIDNNLSAKETDIREDICGKLLVKHLKIQSRSLTLKDVPVIAK